MIKRRARAGLRPRRQWCGPPRPFPKEFNHPPALLGQGNYLINNAGIWWARLFSVSGPLAEVLG